MTSAGKWLLLIAWPDVVALQLSRQNLPCAAYQLNLVWKQTDGAVKRHCLATHVIRRFVVRLARSYESALPFNVIDETREGEHPRQP